VLLDVMMPGLSGLEVLSRIRKGSSRADLPVIMATARDTSEDIVEALKLGANDYVTKPLDFPVVLARVQSALTLKHATDEIQRLARNLEVRNQFIRNTFGRYLSDEIVESLLETPEGLALGGERREVTILMSDLRGFTSLAERIPPEQVVGILNHYLGQMAEIILKHRGTIDEFIGDAILVIFGAPQVREDDARRAVACAIEMQRAMAGVNEFNRSHGLSEVEMGIAVHTGEVVVGNIGSQKRAKYGVVGTPVNMTSRIESYSVGGQVLISEQTLKAAGEAVEAIDPIEIKAKGARQPLRAWDLQSVGVPYDLRMPEVVEEFRALESPVAVRYFRVEGKHVGESAHAARLVRLSERSAEVDSDEDVPPLTNLRLELSGADGQELPGDVYAKVIQPGGDSRGRFTIRFTARPPNLARFLEQCWSGAAGRKSG
jgi:class 3 adenylate cyclase